MHALQSGTVHGELRYRIQNLFHTHAGFETRKRRANTVMHADAEGEMIAEPVAPNIKFVGSLPKRRIAIGRCQNKRDLGALAHRRAVQLDSARQRTGHHVGTRIES